MSIESKMFSVVQKIDTILEKTACKDSCEMRTINKVISSVSQNVGIAFSLLAQSNTEKGENP